jgi:hypothetical protein
MTNTVRLVDRMDALSQRWGAQKTKKAEIEDLALSFRNEVKAEILKHRSSTAVGVIGNFIVNIEAHRARYAKKLHAIRVDADAATVFLADEVGREIDSLAEKEIKRVRDAGRVEFETGAEEQQVPLEIHKTGLCDNEPETIMRAAEPMAEKEIKRVRDAVLEFEPGPADHQVPLEIRKIGLSKDQLETIMRTAGPMAEEKRQEFLQSVAAFLLVRGHIDDDNVSAAAHRALSELIHNSAVWKEWNRNRL